MTYIWYINNTLIEEAHDIIFKAKKGTTVIKKMNTLCKRCKGFSTSSVDLTPEGVDKYENNPNIAKVEFTLK
jgi:hypothetical protein